MCVKAIASQTWDIFLRCSVHCAYIQLYTRRPCAYNLIVWHHKNMTTTNSTEKTAESLKSPVNISDYLYEIEKDIIQYFA